MQHTEAIHGISSETRKKVLTYAGVTAGGLLLLGLLYLIIRKGIIKGRDKNESRKGLDKGAAASYARRLYKAMENDGYPGTDEVKLREVMLEIPDWKTWEEVQRSYEKQYQTVLVDDLDGELQTAEYDEMMEIINQFKLPQDQVTEAHHESWAKRLWNAWSVTCFMGWPCTDEDAAMAVAKEVKAKNAWRGLERKYKEMYGSELQDDADSEMDGYWFTQWESYRN